MCTALLEMFPEVAKDRIVETTDIDMKRLDGNDLWVFTIKSLVSTWYYKSGTKIIAEAALAGNVVYLGGRKYDMNPSRKGYERLR